MKNPWLFLMIVSWAMVHCAPSDNQVSKAVAQNPPFIKPPLKNVRVPWTEFSVDAQKGDTVFCKTGSMLLVPADAFVDKLGNVVAGNVQLKFREFTTPIDFFVSGIPMEFDSLGQKYTFESAGMCEIRAFKDQEEVQVNPRSRPEVYLASNNSDPNFNLYYLDTVQGKWLDRGRCTITDLTAPRTAVLVSNRREDVTVELVKPVKPEKATGKNPIIQVEVDSASYRELLFYDKLQFQLQGDLAGFDPNDSRVEWDNIVLQRKGEYGLYQLEFSRGKKKVSYPVKPVVAGKDYEAALKIFEQKDKAYQNQRNQRLKNESVLAKRANRAAYVNDSLDNQELMADKMRLEKIKLLMVARDKEIERENAAKLDRNKWVTVANNANRVFRGFVVFNFGVMNCDRPTSLAPEQSIPIKADFVNTDGVKIMLSNVAVIFKSPNVLFKNEPEHINVSSVDDNVVCGLVGDQFAYISYKDFRNLHITKETKQQTFTMTVVPANDISYDKMQRISK